MTDEILDAIDSQQETNKASAIRKAFQMMPSDVKPSEVVEHLKRESNIEVSAAYVSVVKGQMSRKNTHTFESMRLAKKLIRETGSMANARSVLEAVQEECDRTSNLRNMYGVQLVEIDVRLNDEDRPLDQKDRRDLITEKKRIQKLIELLEDF